MGVVNTANARQSNKHAMEYSRYRDRGLREINKARKLMRHLRTHADPVAKAALKRIPTHLVDVAEKRYRKTL